MLEERRTTDVYGLISFRQFLWGVRGMDDLVLRESWNTNVSSSSSSSSSSGASGRLYALGDTLSITAIVNTSGTVLERYSYDAFGKVNVMDAGFSPRSSSGYDWETLFCAYRYDGVTGFYQVRNRYLHPTLGRWLSRDPLPNAEMQDGANLYAYVRNASIQSFDSSGLKKSKNKSHLILKNMNADQKKVAKQAFVDARLQVRRVYNYLLKLTVHQQKRMSYIGKCLVAQIPLDWAW